MELRNVLVLSVKNLAKSSDVKEVMERDRGCNILKSFHTFEVLLILLYKYLSVWTLRKNDKAENDTSVQMNLVFRTILSLHCQKKMAKFVPSGVQWLVTGAVPLRAHPLYPFTWVRISTLAVCTFKKEMCTSAD